MNDESVNKVYAASEVPCTRCKHALGNHASNPRCCKIDKCACPGFLADKRGRAILATAILTLKGK